MISEPPLAAIDKGVAKSIPLLIGTNRDEWELFMIGDRGGRRLDRAGLERRMESVLGWEEGRAVPSSRLVLEHYGRQPGRRRPGKIWSDFQSDRVFHWPAARLAERQAAQGSQTFAYVFSWTGPFPLSRLGACHGLELPFVFGTLRSALLRPWIGISARARRLSHVMQDAWIGFARSGEPAHLDLPDWPEYDAAGGAAMIFDGQCRVEEGAFDRARFWERFW
jgi:para-nitrobenzyl esterase